MAPVKSRGGGIMCFAAGPSPAPLSPWQPAHHFPYTCLPALVSWGTGDEGSGTGAIAMEIARSPLIIPRLFPSSRRPAGLTIQEEHDRPDLVLGQKVFPRGHRRIPRRAFARQPGTTLGDPPEDEALGQLRDRAVVLEVRRQRVEPTRVVTLAVEMVAMTRHAILIINSATFGDMRRHLSLFA